MHLFWIRTFRTAWGRALVLLTLFAMPIAANATLPIQSWHLPNGARVLFVENRALPMLDVSVDFPAGYSRDTAALSGCANMTVSMMQLGAGDLSEDTIAARFADIGAQISSRFDADRAGYSVRTLSSERERDQAIGLLASILQKPTFPEKVFERERGRLIAAITESNTKPETIAERAFYSAVYGSHPYGLRASGEIDTLRKLSTEDLRRFYGQWYRSDWAIVAIMGDVSHDDANAIAMRLTADLPRATGDVPALPPVAPLEKPVERDIDHPATQSHILVGQPGIARKDPDYFSLFVGNYILGGGGFASRIMDEVRQKRALAYSAYSYFAPLARAGVFQIGLQTRRDQAREALKVVRDTLSRFVESGPTEAELDAAKQNLIGGFPLRIDSNRKIHEYLAVIGFYDLPLDYLDEFVQRISEVTVDQVKDAFQRRIHPDRMVTVVVGGTDGQK
ncbi:MAG: insulinase family protein [Betaproteobacteria bacterium]|nr:insulinase family protein [Betaproteobacteria bacterium]